MAWNSHSTQLKLCEDDTEFYGHKATAGSLPWMFKDRHAPQCLKEMSNSLRKLRRISVVPISAHTHTQMSKKTITHLYTERFL